MAAAGDANAQTTVLVPGYDPSGHQDRVAFRVTNVATDTTVTPNIVYGDLAIGGSISANNPSVGTLESPIPGSATLIGVSDGAGNLEELVLESDANPNLRVGVFNGANELAVDSNGVAKVLIEAASGVALAADQTNSELRVSLYIKTTTAGDTALTAGQATKANSLPVTMANDQGALGTVAQGSGAATGTSWRVQGDFTEQASLSAGSLNADLVPSTDVNAYSWWAIQVSGTWTGTLTFQGSNDNSNFVSLQTYNVSSFTSISITATVNGVFFGPRNYRYLRIRMTSYTSGTANGTLELYTTAPATFMVGAASAQSGTWTVQPGNTQNTTPWMITQGPTNVGTQVDVSATATNATCTATMAAVSAKTNYISGYEITGLPATSLSSADVTISGLQNTLTAEFAEPVAVMGILQVAFNPPRASSAVNTAISVSVGALGAASAKVAVNVHGFTV